MATMLAWGMLWSVAYSAKAAAESNDFVFTFSLYHK